MNDTIFKQTAIQQGFKSLYKKRLGAVVVYRKNIVGRGYNKVHSTGVPRLDGKHAEIEALDNTRAKYRHGSTVYVCRVTKRGTLALAKPCSSCKSIMIKMGVKYVWYSHENGWTREML